MYNFKNALLDYRYLKDHGYAKKSSLKIVGDRYRLSKIARNCLLRGAVEKKICLLRKKKLILAEEVKDRNLGIDWYNVLITVESYLKGHTIFLADDGIIRDASAVHASYRESAITKIAIEKIITALKLINPGSIEVFLDSPISHSKIMADNLKKKMNTQLLFPISILLIHSADFKLKVFNGIVASSDSVIMDSTENIFDFPRFVLEYFFKLKVQKLELLTL